MSNRFNRFDAVKFDKVSIEMHNRCREACVALEDAISRIGGAGAREKAIAMTQLENVWSRCGRAITDDQFARAGSQFIEEGSGNE